ncbi:hypothetical protein Oweho_1785 [Owenweeksia hongkongensis DSM 17368]|uniref:Uncharacterized protein n=1 Tax=Owenweeksia hongkongensis (strain DSM 17368 / CIP 108786 / JCM 12287 / NRRL B-23963 / UST20020801) TaxID=926562 RepID=G8R150_OWEHD|nr:hypothetical protein [Owenweeksia hongkongensis]AEV32765.1 hypothetical protein Oweho_1785 [Owenweeksia hongkongensis DSM 17368]
MNIITTTILKSIQSVLLGAIIFLSASTKSFAQSEELKQKVSAFKSDLESYEMKYLNISDRDLGSIEETGYVWKDEFMLKSKEKEENNIGNKSYAKYYFSIFSYETIEDRQYGLKDWMGDFINSETLRPGRDMRTYPEATPTIILINDLEIITCNYKCSDFSDDGFDNWKDMLLKYFGEDNTMVIEIMCDGPLKWTKNAPDPKDRRKMI